MLTFDSLEFCLCVGTGYHERDKSDWQNSVIDDYRRKMALHLRRYRAAYCCTGRRIFSIIENSRKKGKRERKTLPVTRRKNLEIVSLLFILPHFYPTCVDSINILFKKKRINYWKRALLASWYKEIEILSFLSSSSSSPFLLILLARIDRCKFKSKIFENIVFTLESIYFVSFQYKERNIISLYSKEIVFLLFLFFFSRVFSRDSLEKN